jgi:predicted outer membrane protein
MVATARTVVAVLAAAIAIAACNNDNHVLDDRVVAVEVQGTEAGSAAAGLAATELTGDSAAVVIGKTASILLVLNTGALAAGSIALAAAQTSAVQGYAGTIVHDHFIAGMTLDAVVRGLGAAFLPSATADQLTAQGTALLAQLQATPVEDIDLAFMQLMVSQHAAALVLLDELAAQVGSNPLGDFIANAIVVEQGHLDQGELILNTFF